MAKSDALGNANELRRDVRPPSAACVHREQDRTVRACYERNGIKDSGTALAIEVRVGFFLEQEVTEGVAKTRSE
jgi:hypothetical protein